MRILIICYVFPPETAPAGVMVSELAEDLANQGHDVTVLTGLPNHPAGKLFPGFQRRWRCVTQHGRYRLMRVEHAIYPKTSPPARLWTYLTFAISSLINGMTLGRQDAILSLSTPLFGVWTAWFLARLWRARFVNAIFDLWPEAIKNASLIGDSPFYRLVRWVDTVNCHLSDEVTTLGEGLKQQILARGISPAKIHIVPFWVDTHKIRPLDRLNTWRREQGIADDTFVALCAGTMGYASGVQILVDVAEALRARPDILLLIVGEGVVKNQMIRQAQERNLSNIRFLPFQPAERLAEMQSAADVGLVTLLPESGTSSVPSKVLGYMGASRAIVASVRDDSDTAHLIRQANCGSVTPPQDAAAIAQAVLAAAAARESTHRQGANGREFLLQHLSRQRCTRLYEQLLTGQPHPPERTDGPRPDPSFRVIPARLEHLEGMARCHITCFADQFISHMGLSYCMAFYRQYLEEGLSFVAVSTDTGQVVGAIAGGKPDIRVRFHLRAQKRFRRQLVVRALQDPLIRSTLLGYLRTRLSPGAKDRLQAALEAWSTPGPEPRATLMVIGVLPEWRGSGAAGKLISIFEGACWDAGFRAIDLRVHADNARAIAFYRKMGWHLLRTGEGLSFMRQLSPGTGTTSDMAAGGATHT